MEKREGGGREGGMETGEKGRRDGEEEGRSEGQRGRSRVGKEGGEGQAGCRVSGLGAGRAALGKAAAQGGAEGPVAQRCQG